MRKELIGAVSALALLSGTALAQGTASDSPSMQNSNQVESTGAMRSNTTPHGSDDSAAELKPGSSSSTESGSAISGDTATNESMGSAPAGKPAQTASAEALMGKKVIGSDGQEIGEVSDVIVDPSSGQAERLVISSGGFLGIGEKQVAIDYSEANVQPNEDALQVSNLTQQDIEGLPEFEYDDTMTSLNRMDQRGGVAQEPAVPSQQPVR